ncbi:hypothetical protein F4777DRAFT_551419 [Nemania sp. FL0916]|nr:hypothetical protein F4777DRAFT_551419 [Nemania sp. FL0916]
MPGSRPTFSVWFSAVGLSSPLPSAVATNLGRSGRLGGIGLARSFSAHNGALDGVLCCPRAQVSWDDLPLCRTGK